MPRRPRLAAGDLAYHVLNRRVGRLPLFKTPADYTAFEKILAEAHAQTKIRIAAYCLMPNHWHLLLGPGRMGNFLKSSAGSPSRIPNAGMPTIALPGQAPSTKAASNPFRSRPMSISSPSHAMSNAMRSERSWSHRRKAGNGRASGGGIREMPS